VFFVLGDVRSSRFCPILDHSPPSHVSHDGIILAVTAVTNFGFLLDAQIVESSAMPAHKGLWPNNHHGRGPTGTNDKAGLSHWWGLPALTSGL
jgi:hypothetical protein